MLRNAFRPSCVSLRRRQNEGWEIYLCLISGKGSTHRIPCIRGYVLQCLHSLTTSTSRRSWKYWQNPSHAGAQEWEESLTQKGFHSMPHQPTSRPCAGCTVNSHGREHSSFYHCTTAITRRTVTTTDEPPCADKQNRSHLGVQKPGGEYCIDQSKENRVQQTKPKKDEKTKVTTKSPRRLACIT